MNETPHTRWKNLLRATMPPVSDAGPAHDLWPALQVRLHAPPVPEPLTHFRLAQIPWFDWVLAGALAGFVLLFPATIPMLLYYL